MTPRDAGLHPVSKKITLLFGSILLTNIVAAHRCYVCGPVQNSDPNFGARGVPTCDKFDPMDEAGFSRECPPKSRGCSIQTNGTVFTRTCEDIAVDDCKTANHVKYCYCRTDLCNADASPRPGASPDDEDGDQLEGSGHRNVDNVLSVPKMTYEMSASTPQTVRASAAVRTRACQSLIVLVLFRFWN